jgi:hypothetical protein
VENLSFGQQLGKMFSVDLPAAARGPRR